MPAAGYQLRWQSHRLASCGWRRSGRLTPAGQKRPVGSLPGAAVQQMHRRAVQHPLRHLAHVFVPDGDVDGQTLNAGEQILAPAHTTCRHSSEELGNLGVPSNIAVWAAQPIRTMGWPIASAWPMLEPRLGSERQANSHSRVKCRWSQRSMSTCCSEESPAATKNRPVQSCEGRAGVQWANCCS